MHQNTSDPASAHRKPHFMRTLPENIAKSPTGQVRLPNSPFPSLDPTRVFKSVYERAGFDVYKPSPQSRGKHSGRSTPTSSSVKSRSVSQIPDGTPPHSPYAVQNRNFSDNFNNPRQTQAKTPTSAGSNPYHSAGTASPPISMQINDTDVYKSQDPTHSTNDRSKGPLKIDSVLANRSYRNDELRSLDSAAPSANKSHDPYRHPMSSTSSHFNTNPLPCHSKLRESDSSASTQHSSNPSPPTSLSNPSQSVSSVEKDMMMMPPYDATDHALDPSLKEMYSDFGNDAALHDEKITSPRDASLSMINGSSYEAPLDMGPSLMDSLGKVFESEPNQPAEEKPHQVYSTGSGANSSTVKFSPLVDDISENFSCHPQDYSKSSEPLVLKSALKKKRYSMMNAHAPVASDDESIQSEILSPKKADFNFESDYTQNKAPSPDKDLLRKLGSLSDHDDESDYGDEDGNHRLDPMDSPQKQLVPVITLNGPENDSDGDEKAKENRNRLSHMIPQITIEQHSEKSTPNHSPQNTPAERHTFEFPEERNINEPRSEKLLEQLNSLNDESESDVSDLASESDHGERDAEIPAFNPKRGSIFRPLDSVSLEDAFAQKIDLGFPEEEADADAGKPSNNSPKLAAFDFNNPGTFTIQKHSVKQVSTEDRPDSKPKQQIPTTSSVNPVPPQKPSASSPDFESSNANSKDFFTFQNSSGSASSGTRLNRNSFVFTHNRSNSSVELQPAPQPTLAHQPHDSSARSSIHSYASNVGSAHSTPPPPSPPPVFKHPPGEGPCRKCGLDIVQRPIYSKTGELSGQWHRNCFKCTACDVTFNKNLNCFVLDDEPYCELHYHIANNSLCRVCDNGIIGQCLENDMRERYHMDCLKCTRCAQLVDSEYLSINGHVFCEPCALEFTKVHSASTVEKRRTRISFI